MTHGGGSMGACSGGGGFSGGATIAWTAAGWSSRGSRHSSAECKCGDWLAFLACCFGISNYLTATQRVKILSFWFVIAALTCGFSTRFAVFRDSHITISPSDELMIAPPPATTTFCTKQSIELSHKENNGQVTVYFLPSVPPIGTDVDIYDFSHRSLIVDGNYEYFGYHLLQDSRIHARLSSRDFLSDLTLLLIFGDKNFNAWKKDPCDSSRWLVKKAASGVAGGSFNTTILETGQYYIVVSAGFTSFYDLNINLVRKTYDLSGSLANCTMFQTVGEKHRCMFNIERGSDNVLVVKADSKKFFSYEDTLTVSLAPNLIIYFTVFLILPVAILLVLTFIIVKLERRKSPEKIKISKKKPKEFSSTDPIIQA